MIDEFIAFAKDEYGLTVEADESDTPDSFDKIFNNINYLKRGEFMEEQTTYKKPPIGLVPRRIHDDERKIAIFEAMKRYSLNDVVIPIEWIDELIELCMK